MIVRNATPADAEWIAEVCHRQFQVAHKGGLLPADLQYYVDKTFVKSKVLADMEVPGNHYLAAVSEDGEPLGCVKLGPVALPQAINEHNAMEITRFYVVPGMIGKGVGNLLMDAAIEKANRLHQSSVWLHVYKKNERAVRFYEKAGFVIVGEQDFPVRNSRPVGWVMKIGLLHN